MHERVKSEIDLLRQKQAKLQHDDKFSWVLIAEYPLPPERYNKSTTQLLFLIPPGYPNTGPDNFFVDGDLKLKDGSNPPGFNAGSNSSSGNAPVSGNWGWFSWHPTSWQPAATIEGGDNLLTFVRGVNMCLMGIEST